jgi:hypothetical protein
MEMKVFIPFILSFIVLSMYGQEPVLCFTDLISGPSKGNTDNSQTDQIASVDGAIVTMWGAHLGSSKNDNEVYVGDAKARIYFWGDATVPADLFSIHKLQKISFQIPATIDTGLTQIFVIIDGVKSNSLHFTIRKGNVYFVDPLGNDDTGDGSWQKPWKTLDNANYTGALEKILPGDILYLKDGLTHKVLVGDRACIDIGNPGTHAMPKAIIGYPQAHVEIGDINSPKTFSLWVSGYGPSTHWVISGLRLTAMHEAVSMYHDFRVVGNFITAPLGDGPTGAVAGQGNDLYLLGNELTQIGSLATSKLYHPIYIQSAEACSGPRLPLERNRVIAFNYLHDNLSYDGINLYRECGSSAYMTDHQVYNNAIINQTGCGIRCGDYVVGENHIYNNLIINSGLGPDPTNEYAMHVPLLIHAGWNDTTTLIHCYNNTIVGGGFVGGQAWASSMVGFFKNHPFQLDFRNNIIVSTISGIKYYNDRFDLPDNTVNNLWFGAGASPSWDHQGVAIDPLFISNTDFRLAENSPAIGQAKPFGNVSNILPIYDFIMRKRDDAPDIGAFENEKDLASNMNDEKVDLPFYRNNHRHIEIDPAFSNKSSHTMIMNMMGQTVVNTNSNTIDIHNLQNSVYILVHFYNDDIKTVKILVAK